MICCGSLTVVSPCRLGAEGSPPVQQAQGHIEGGSTDKFNQDQFSVGSTIQLNLISHKFS